MMANNTQEAGVCRIVAKKMAYLLYHITWFSSTQYIPLPKEIV